MIGSGSMVSGESERPRGGVWRRVAALGLVVAGAGLPLNQIGLYALVVLAAVVIFTGSVNGRLWAWLLALAAAAVSAALQILVAPQPIAEGHNIFLPGGVLEKQLPGEVYRTMAQQFDRQYPPDRRCDPRVAGCWLSAGMPDRVFAFSADGVLGRAEFSRNVSGIDVSDPVWQRLGFVNEFRYNWYAGSDLQRATRDRKFWMGLHRWHLTIPWFVVYRFPAAYEGATLCWRGDLLWEGEGGRYERLSHPEESCRAVARADIGRRIFGIAVKPETLAIDLHQPFSMQLRRCAQIGLAVIGVAAVLGLLVQWRPRRLILPLILIGAALLTIAVDDASFIGGVRPFDGGDDGLFYDGVGRTILQNALAGNVAEALRGGEDVFYYGGPGLRYLRALEHLIFGESYLGYLALVLVFPFAMLALFRRFLTERWALASAVIFVGIPVGALFGTTFINYGQWAGRGFADPAAYMLFVCGLAVLLRSDAARFAPAFFGALLLALAIFMKPVVAPAVAVMLGGAGLAAIYQRQWPRLVGLCLGFLPMLVMPLHNWVFGRVFVLFSANAAHPDVLVMPPSAWLDVLSGHQWRRAISHLAHALSGPSESLVLAPLDAAAVAVVVYVLVRGRGFDPWLRLIAAAALAQLAVALFYIASARYHYLSWLLVLLVTLVWAENTAMPWLGRHYARRTEAMRRHPLTVRLASGLSWLQRVSA